MTTTHMNLAIFTLFLTFEDWKPPKIIFFKNIYISHFGDISTSEKNGSAKAQNPLAPFPLVSSS
jgi:hypothetical protein